MNKIELLKPKYNSWTGNIQASKNSEPAGKESGRFTRSDTAAILWNALEEVSEDRSIPLPVSFSWKSISTVPEKTTYDLFIAMSKKFTDPLVRENLSEPFCNIWNLHIDTRYYWKVIARNADHTTVESPVRTFRTHATLPRWIYVPGMTNVRDIGGWRLPGNRLIQQSLIYRSSEMNSHLNITEEGKRVLVDELKIRTDLDLRGSDEETRPVLDRAAVKWINIPIRPYSDIALDVYREKYRDIFKIFADSSNYPIMFHCWGGCDRSGTVALLLHALLGLDMDSLVQDYEFSSLTIWGERSHLSEQFQALLQALSSFGKPGHDMKTQVENYLRSIGVTAREIAAIRSNLTAKSKKRS